MENDIFDDARGKTRDALEKLRLWGSASGRGPRRARALPDGAHATRAGLSAIERNRVDIASELERARSIRIAATAHQRRLEGANNKLGVLKRIAYGFVTADNFAV